MRFALHLFITLIATLALTSRYSQADNIVVGSNATGTTVPFFLFSDFQQVYDSTLFTGPMEIEEISFFRQAGSTASTGDRIDPVNYTISLAVTNISSTSFSGELGDNSDGLALHTFYDSTATQTTGYSGTDAVTFAGNSFVYDPSDGNLLMQIIKSADHAAGNLTVQASFVSAGQAMTTNATGVENRGLVTNFVFASVPEPSSLILLSLSTGVAVFRRRRAA